MSIAPVVEDPFEIFKYVKAIMGYPVVEIEITDEQLNLFLKNSLETYSRVIPYIKWYSIPAFPGVQEYILDKGDIGNGIVDVMIPRIDPIAPLMLCLDGETKITLLDGRSRSILELQEEYGSGEFWVYSASPDGSIHPGRAHSIRQTGSEAETVEVEISNGDKVYCTPEHRWMLRDGTYREAKDLQPGDSLMPLYRQSSSLTEDGREGYDKFLDNPTGKWKYTHWRVAKDTHGIPEDFRSSFGTDKWVVHHKDCEKSNNSPENLEWMRSSSHREWHNNNWELTLGRWRKENPAKVLENEERMRAAAAKYWSTPEGKERAKENGRAVLSRRWREDYETMRENTRTAGRAFSERGGPEYDKFIQNLIEKNRTPERKELSRKTLSETWAREGEVLADKIKRGWRSRLESDPEFVAAMADRTRRLKDKYGEELNRRVSAGRKKKFQDDPAFAEAHKARTKEFFDKNSKDLIKKRVLKQVKAILSKIQGPITEESYNAARDKYRDEKGLKVRNAPKYERALEVMGDLAGANHTIVSVKPAAKRDVYDLTVDEYHNFALDCGVFVHNSSGPRMDIFGYRYSYPYRDISELYIDYMYFTEATKILSSDFQWDYRDGKLLITPKPDEPFSLSFAAAHPRDMSSIPASDIDWVRMHVLAQTEIAVGRVRRKYRIPGSHSEQLLDGSVMVQEGLQRLLAMEAELMKRTPDFGPMRTN